MRLARPILIRLGIVIVVALVAITILLIGYVQVPTSLGMGRYTVTVELPQSGGLYRAANVTYRGTEVGKVTDVSLTNTGVKAVLSLSSDIDIPADLDAEVHSQSAVGEQFVALVPRSGDGPSLKNGDIIAADRTSVPPEISGLLDATNRGLQAIPQDDLRTVIDESYIGLNGLGPELSRFVRGSTTVAIDSGANVDSLTALIDRSWSVADTQNETADAISAWTSHLASVTGQLARRDGDVGRLLVDGAPAAEQARRLIDRLRPTVPLIMANLVAVGEVALAYQPSLEQLLVLLPQGAAAMQATLVPNKDTKQDYHGAFLSLHIFDFNVPPPCVTGFLPAQQRRAAAEVDTPDRPAGDLYCRIPQDSPYNVRGARNIPCVTRPGKRAPTAKICESDEQYVPLNDGTSWKGDPNATLSVQGIPQLPPGEAAPSAVPAAESAAPIAATEYDPATGVYIGPDGNIYTQADLAQTAGPKTWQSMLFPAG